MENGRIVVVTGAAGGIGARIVDRFLANGDTIFAIDNRSDALEDGVRLCQRQLVPSHVRNLERPIRGRHPHDVAFDPTQSPMIAKLTADLRQKLHAHADSEEGLGVLQDDFSERVDHSGNGA